MKNGKYILSFTLGIFISFLFINTTNALNLSAPSPVTNFTGSATTNSVSLAWDTPNEPSLSEFELRYSTSPITSGNFNVATQVSGVPAPVSGTSQTAQVSGLSANTKYYFGIKIIGASGSYSPLVTTSVVTTTSGGGGGGGSICTKPSPLSDITYSSTKNSIDISWRTSPESGLSEFDIRYSTSSLNFANFLFGTKITAVSIPVTNKYQTASINGLSSDTTYYFGLGVLNACGLMSDPAFIFVKTAMSSAPSPVTNFTGGATTNNASLAWDTPNEPGLAEFELRYSTDPITSGNFNVATQVSGIPTPVSGTNQTTQVSGLNSGTKYYFAIKIIGASGSYSSLTTTSVTTTATGGGGGCTSNCGGGGSSGLVIIGGGGNAFNPSSIIINNGDIVTFNRLVNLKISSNGATEMLLSNRKDFIGAKWKPYNTTSTWILSPKTGSKTVYARFRNLVSEIKNYVSDKIFLIASEPKPIPTPTPIIPRPRPPVNAGIGPWFSILPDNILIPNEDDFDIVVIAHAGKDSTNYFAKMELVYPKDLIGFKSITYNKGWIPTFNKSDNNNNIENGILTKAARYPKGFKGDNVFAVITFSVKNRGKAVFRFGNNETAPVQKVGEHKFKNPTQSSLSVVDKKPKSFFANIFDAVLRFFSIFK